MVAESDKETLEIIEKFLDMTQKAKNIYIYI
jgi:hypothetical protein